MLKKRKKRRKHRSLAEAIKITSSKHLDTLLSKLKPGSVKTQIKGELAARDSSSGGPDKNWGHG